MTALLTVAVWLAQAVSDAEVPEAVTDPENQLVLLIAGFLIPLATALVTRIDASSTLKGITTTLLAVAVAIFQAWQDGGEIWTSEVVIDAVTAWVLAAVSYATIWKGKVAPAIQRAVPGGIGGSSPVGGA